MKAKRITQTLVLLIVLFAGIASAMGTFTYKGEGNYQIESIRGQEVAIYGKGIYQHMSVEVAVQGMAQDYVTLFLAIPLLLLAFFWAKSGSIKGRFLLAGVLSYFLVTYLFYLCMAMYNVLFLAYVVLCSASFFAFLVVLMSFDLKILKNYFTPSLPIKFLGGFLIFNAIAIGLMWLSVVLPPLLDGRIFPPGLEHYTTLIVQGLDLALLLPAAFLIGIFLLQKKNLGYLLAPVYLIFLALLMTALSAKLIGQIVSGVIVSPVAAVVIPLFNLTAIICAVLSLKNLKEKARLI